MVSSTPRDKGNSMLKENDQDSEWNQLVNTAFKAVDGMFPSLYHVITSATVNIDMTTPCFTHQGFLTVIMQYFHPLNLVGIASCSSYIFYQLLLLLSLYCLYTGI